MSIRLQASSATTSEIRAVLHGLGEDLAKWLHGQLLRLGGKKWWDHHVRALVLERDQHRIADGEWSELEDLDLSALLNLLQSNFRFLTSGKALKKEHRETIRAMKGARNRCEGHWPVKGIPLDEVLIHLDALREFSRMIGGGRKRGEQISALSASVEQSVAADSTPAPSSPAEKTLPPMISPGGKRLADYFGTDQLTDSQSEAIVALQHFLEDPNEQCFVLRGYAGTGKTFLIGGLVRYLTDVHRKPQMMAPTGRAAHVLRERHQVEASTIHRSIYSLKSLKDYRELDERGDITYKFYFDLKNNDIDHDTVFIVDEASMISDLYSESEFMHFGTGRLLPDLLRFINFDGNDYRKKLILVGDDAQLPPVGMNFSPALDQEYLQKKCLIKSGGCELTDVVRQLESSPILKNATEMRRMLREDRFQKFEFLSNGETIRELKPDRFIESFVCERDPESFSTAVIVAFKNETTKTYNEAVRDRLFPGKESITANDQIIVVRNNYNYERELLNGQMGLVVAAEGQLETRTVPLNVGLDEEGKPKVEAIKLQFRNATLRFSDDKGDPFDVSCKISEDCLLNGLASLPSNYSKALYVDFQKRHPDLRPGHAEFKEALKADPYFNAVMLKFGYAITCHKAQGGEWRTVFVDFAGKNKLNADSMRWSYTALTRAETSVVATNALHHHILKPTKQRTAPVTAAPENLPVHRGVVSHTPRKPENLGTVGSVSSVLKPAEMIRHQVEQVLPKGWKIDSIRTLPYQERVIFSVGSSRVTASIYYKSNQRISKIQITPVQGQDAIDQQAADFLVPLKGLSLVQGQEVPPEVMKAHQPFVDELKGKLVEEQLELVSLKSNTEFHLVVRLRHGHEEGSVNYYFKGEGTFTSYGALPDCPGAIIERIQSIHG